MERTDADRLDALNALAKGYGTGWILRNSSTLRGMRLHESDHPDGESDVRKAIDKYLDEIVY
jgi:hypothetical protein